MKTMYSFFIFLLVALPVATFAFSTPLPFGGRITVVKTPPNVECTGDPLYSPFEIMPVGGGTQDPGPWSALPGLINVGTIGVTGWIIGMITTPVSTDCTQYDGEEAHPYPTTATDFWGTSLPSYR